MAISILKEAILMLNHFNLVVTTFRHREKALITECICLLTKTGDPKAQFHTTNISGIVIGITIYLFLCQST